MFTAAWKKNAKILAKGAKKFVDYKRDLLTPERVAEIESRRKDLLSAIRERSREKVEEASKQLRATCENALPREKPQSWFEENVEVMFVAIVIALGLRAYYMQPFRIPTGSMQPTLNGIVGTPLPSEQWPSLPQRLIEFALRGRSYVKVVNDQDRQIAPTSSGAPDVRDIQWFHFFSKAQIYFTNSKPLRLPAPTNPCMQIGLGDAIRSAAQNGGILKAGTTVCEGIIDSGDLVLVDKFTYHFRRPKRGEVFVFDTLGIRGIQEHSGPQGGGSHYIKRLVGVPGDTLSIKTPDLLVDGKVAQEPGIRRVAEGASPFKENHKGYVLAQPSNKLHRYLVNEDDVLSLKGKEAAPGMREYAAMGDNTGNSLDSRYWGSVKEYNLVGPAAFSLWPITSGHWGFIR
ncbi:signal peptidase I [Luteolibacter algae]|uniref:Signal peptidase I n=1 Tax=Luteolibacter algae TaxID=454151 RepID=A0ABW5DAM4_9BACT